MNNDIKTLLLKIKDNIKLIEDGAADDDRLDEVRSDYLEMIELIKLFLISERDSYYGYFLMNMQFSVEFFSNSIAGIKLNTFPPVFAANPLLLCKFSLKEIIYIVCHEIDHVVLNHPAEMVKSNPENDEDTFFHFNCAADAAVNDRINNEIENENRFFMSQPDGTVDSSALAKMFNLKNVIPNQHYAYYFNLIKNKNKKKNADRNAQESMMNAVGSDEGEESKENNSQSGKSGEQNENSNSGQSGQPHTENEPGQENESGSTSSTDAENEGELVTSKNCKGNLEDHNWEAGEDAEDVTATVREFVNTAVSTMSSERRGLMPGDFLEQVESLNKPPEISWQKVLKKYVGTISANKRKTRTRLNRRQPDRFDLSGTMDDKVLKIVVAIDTSGSMSNSMISRCLNEIFAILSKRKHEITIIECDSAIGRVYKAKTPADIKKKVTGRGGTWFSPVIKYINDDKYFRDSLLIYFTDGWGEREIPKPKTYRNIWVVIGDKNDLSLKEPYGIVLEMKGE